MLNSQLFFVSLCVICIVMKFTLQHTAPATNARAGFIETDHGNIETPIFMPVGTAAAMKGIFHRDVEEEAKAQIILANTYHLYLRPGMDIIELSVDILVVVDKLVALKVFRLKLHALLLSLRDNPEAEHKACNGNDACAKHIWPHQAAEADTTREHRHNLGLHCQLRGEEDYRDKGEERTKLVYKVRNEVQIVVENNGIPGCVQLCKVVDTLHIVEDNQDDGHHQQAK